MHTRDSKQIPPLAPQRGAALFMALVFLLIMTILGVFGMNMSRMETMMAGNNQFQTAALNDAELALRIARNDLEDTLTSGIDFNAAGDYFYDSTDVGTLIETVDPTVLDWSSITHASPASNSRYVIEYGGCHAKFGNSNVCNDPLTTCFDTGACGYVYNITAQSETSRGAKRTIQSSFALITGPSGP